MVHGKVSRKMEAAVSLKRVILVYETTWYNCTEERDRQCLNQSVKLSATDCREDGLFIIRIILGLGYRLYSMWLCYKCIVCTAYRNL
jgi:hypothetical protein